MSVEPIRLNVKEPDDYVFVVIETPEKPTVTLDIHNAHGRRTLSVRINGMSIGGLLLDVEELPGVSHRIERFCPYCGEELNIVSARPHKCEESRL